MEDQKGPNVSQQSEPAPKPTKKAPQTGAQRQAKFKANKKAKEDAASRKWNSQVEIKPKDAKEILINERLIRNPRVVEVCVELAEVASRNLKLPFNAHLFTHGIQKTLEAHRIKKAVEPPVTEDVWYPGERVREHELNCLWDYSTSWRTQPNGSQITFEQWKEYRRRCITDVLWFGNFVLGKDFQPEPHGRWAAELFPQLESALMMLPETFGQKDIADAFHIISDVRQRCLIAARSSYKSTFSTAFALALTLCFAGSLRMLVCTATQPLAKGFARSFRNYLTVRDPVNSTLMNQLWPEHCIAPDEGKSLEYTSPFRQLDILIEPTLMATSVISEGQAGMRYDFADFDDCAEISNSSTPEMRAKTQERVDMLRELGEPHSLTNYVGTPISPGTGTEEDPGDLYSVLLRREEVNQREGNAPKLLYAICPAWAVKSGVKKTAWDSTLAEDEVDLLFPSRLTFKYLMGKLKENLATDKTAKVFRQQSLCSWVPDAEADDLVQFSEDELRNQTRPIGSFSSPVSRTVLAIDRAYSTSKFADFSCLVTGKITQLNQKPVCVIADVILERWKESDLVLNIVETIRKFSPGYVVCQKDKNWEDLWAAIRKALMLRGIPSPHFIWKDINTTPQAKAKRVKNLIAQFTEQRKIQMTTELEAKQKAEIEVAHKWMRRHAADFEPNPENSKKITDFIKDHGLAERESNLEANLETAFVALTRQGVKFTTAAAPAAPSTPAAPAEDQLPEIPSYFPKMETKKDIAAIPREKFLELYRGKHGSMFKARLEAITKRGV